MKLKKSIIYIMSISFVSLLIFNVSVVGKAAGAAETTGASEVSSSAIGVASDSAIGLSDVSINATSRKMGIGEKFKLKLSDLPDDAKVTWKSSNKKVATVSKWGTVTARGTGWATITATAQDGTEIAGTYKLKVVSNIQPGSLTLTGAAKVVEGHKITLHPEFDQEVQPSSTAMTWTSSNTAVSAAA